MWKTIYILLIFNTNSNDFEKVKIGIIENEKDKRILEMSESLTESKHKEFKFLKIIKDSVYIPDDSCYSKNKNGTLQYLKTK